jgi:hypothetical protein
MLDGGESCEVCDGERIILFQLIGRNVSAQEEDPSEKRIDTAGASGGVKESGAISGGVGGLYCIGNRD